jgi:predicted dehydrogenase
MKALFVGLGGVGQRHLRNLRTLLGDSVDVLAFRRRGLTQTLTDKLEIEPNAVLEQKYGVRSFTSLEAALAEKPRVTFVCNPSSLHVEVARAAAEVGSHLFVEKPISDSLDGLDALASVVEGKKLASLVGYQLRFHPLLRALAGYLDAGAVGPVLAVKAEVGEYLPAWHPYEDYRQMYASRRALGGGVILSQIHELDYLYSFFGLPKRIFALGGHLSSLEVDVEDVASVSMEHVVDGRTLPIHLHQDYVQRPPSRTCVVVGDQGRIALDFHQLAIRVFDGKGRIAEERAFPGFERNQLFLDEMKHFLAAADGKEKSIVSIREGTQSLRMALAARESIETGKVVELRS